MTPRTLTVTRLLDAVALLARGARDAGSDPALAAASRILAVRQLLQAALTAGTPTPRALRIGAAVDAAHGASMLLLAVGSRRRRGPALQSAVLAVGLALGAERDQRAPV